MFKNIYSSSLLLSGDACPPMTKLFTFLWSWHILNLLFLKAKTLMFSQHKSRSNLLCQAVPGDNQGKSGLPCLAAVSPFVSQLTAHSSHPHSPAPGGCLPRKMESYLPGAAWLRGCPFSHPHPASVHKLCCCVQTLMWPGESILKAPPLGSLCFLQLPTLMLM